MVCNFNDSTSDAPILTDDIISELNNMNLSEYLNSLFTEYSIDGNTLIGTINISKDTLYYIDGDIDENGIGPEITIEGISASFVSMNGDENITLLPTDVSSYKDAGVSYNGKTLTGNDVYSYTNLKDKEGDYKYIYVVKTNQGVKIYRRYITVTNNTSEKCFKFNKKTQEIEQYYYFENNVSSGKKCPMNVVIPEKISGVQVKSIGNGAFTYSGCGDSIIKTSSSNTKYSIKKMLCSIEPIGINSAVLPEGLENIGSSAFYENNLPTVTIPSTITKIGYNAFYNNQLQSVIFKGDKSKISIGCDAFYGNKHSSSVNAIAYQCK